MFQRLFKRAESAAESAIDQIVAKYAGRAMVALPLLVAGGFATAALTIKLIELYGSIAGYALMAAFFALIALVALAFVGVRSRAAPQKAAEEPGAESATPTAAAEEPLDADLFPPELRAMLASVAPMALPGLARGVSRNLPLILVLALVGFIISRFAESATPPDDAAASSGDTNADSATPSASEAPIAAAA